MYLGRSIRHGIAWLFAGNSGYQALNFLLGVVLARLLTPHDFGLLLTVSIFTGIAGFVAGGGLGQALVRAEDVDRHDYNAVFTVQLVVGCLIYAFFFAAAPLIAHWYSEPLFTPLVRISALSFILRPFVNLPTNWLYRNMRFKVLAITNVVDLLFGNSISIALAWSGHGVWSLVYGGLVGAAISAVLRTCMARWRPRLSAQFDRVRKLATYGALVTIGDFIVYVRGQMANFVLSKTLGPASVGLFNKASSLVHAPHQQFTSSVYEVTLRVLAKEQADVSLSQYLYLRSITLVGVYAWPIFLALGWLALPIIRAIYGPKWIEAAPVLTVLALIGPFGTLELMAGSVLAARGWVGREIPVQVTQSAILILGALTGVQYGLIGVAVAVCAAHLYGAAHLSWLASRCLSMRLRRVCAAASTPLVMNLALATLWLSMDRLTKPQADLIYMAVMLFSGGVFYIGLFFIAPIPSLSSERQRWIRLLRAARFKFSASH